MATQTAQGTTADKDEWVALQKKTFTRWCNSYLSNRQLTITNLFVDVNDGLVMLNLLEIIGTELRLSVCALCLTGGVGLAQGRKVFCAFAVASSTRSQK